MITRPNRTQKGAAHTTRAATISRARHAASCDTRARAAAAAPSGRRRDRRQSRTPLRTPRRAARRSSRGSAGLTALSTGAADHPGQASLGRRSGSRAGRRCRPAAAGGRAEEDKKEESEWSKEKVGPPGWMDIVERRKLTLCHVLKGSHQLIPAGKLPSQLPAPQSYLRHVRQAR